MNVLADKTNEEINDIARTHSYLTPDSVVFEVGAYKGAWACAIHDMYDCRVYAFEPQDWAFDLLVEESYKRRRLYPFHFALGNKSHKLQMFKHGTDMCSFVSYNDGSLPDADGYMRDIREFLHSNYIETIDLMMVNIEGYEYQFLWYLITSGVIYSINHLFVQWHTFADPDNSQRDKILEYLLKFFNCTLAGFPTLEGWERKQ